ncbi:DNA internalization-related competence protein ComEC/Rec2 [Salinisphaera aquimarina]|uniref:DNA internalization-related competence protein ComEC/Rec2 n=1 Tax=Salinisphaera aquimarina TaxID=2094031 RepID=A0ABV7EP42_9GAMM
MTDVRASVRVLSRARRQMAASDGDPRLMALAVVGGAGVVYCQPAPPHLWPIALGLAFCLWRFPGRMLVAVCLITIAWSSFLAQQQLQDRWPATRSGEVVWVSGHVVGLPEHNAFRTRFVLERDRAPHRLRLSWYDDAPALVPGQCLRVKAKLETPHGSANPGTFDYEAWLWRRGIDATGYVKERGHCDLAWAGGWTDRLRADAVARLDAILGDSPMRGIIEALTLGVRQGISDSQWTVLRTTGTTHLVAISGLHIGLIATLLYLLARWLLLRLWPAVAAGPLAALFAFAGGAGYALLAGFALPTQRALVMVAVGLYAVAAMRVVAPSRMLALAAITVVAWDPATVIAPGFWLSFGAVAWLLYLGQGARASRARVFLRLQFGLVAGLMPLTLWFFGQASLISPLINALLIPLAAVAVPVLLAVTLMACLVPAIGGPLLLAMARLLEFGWGGLVAAANWPLAAVHLALPGPLALLLALAGLVLLAMPRGLPGRWLALILLVPAVAGWRPANTAIGPGAYRLTVLDVGQGLATVVRTRTHTLVFDAGPAYRTGFNAGDAFVVPYLRHVGRPRVDRLVVSHSDTDHIGGAAAIENALTVLKRQGARSRRPCVAGQRWLWDGVVFEFVYPTPAQARAAPTTNQRSCVLRIEGAGGASLLTGDIEASAERALVAQAPARLAALALVVAHHGSASSSSPVFVDAVSPRYALISAGWHNQWGFPAPAVVTRLRSVGAELANTATGGALQLNVPAAGGAVVLTRWRGIHRRFWQAP